MAQPLNVPIIVGIEELVTAPTVNPTDFLVISQNGDTLKAEVQDVLSAVNTNGFQTGDIIMTGSGAARTGFGRCDWTFYDPASKPALFAVIGYSFGQDGGGFFAYPDFRGRSPMGDGTGVTHPGLVALTARTIGDYPGAETASQAHTHTITIANASLTVAITVNPIAYNLTATGTITVNPYEADIVATGTVTVNPQSLSVDFSNATSPPHHHTVNTIAVTVSVDPATINVANHQVYTTSDTTITVSGTQDLTHAHTGTFSGTPVSIDHTHTATFSGTAITGTLSATATGVIPNHNHTGTIVNATVTVSTIQPSTVVRFLIKE